MVRRLSRQRGFTLLELMVAGAVAVIILTGALALLVHSSRLKRRQMELSELNRDASRLLGQLTQELRQTGLGRPRGVRFLSASDGGELFLPPFVVAEPRKVGFVADLPRPNSNFNGISYLADDQIIIPSTVTPLTPFVTNGLAVLNELNGGCDVTTVAFGFGAKCTTNTNSAILPAADTVDCGGPGSSFTTSPSCPWGLRKYQGNEYVIVADASGKWVERQLFNADPPIKTVLNRRLLNITLGVPQEMVTGLPNRALLSTPDRVFYQLVPEATPVTATTRYRLERKQCWGELTSALTSTIALSNTAPVLDCTSEGTGYEVLIGGLEADAIDFKYYDGREQLLAQTDLMHSNVVIREKTLRRIRRVNIQIKLKREPKGMEALTHSTFLSINLRH